MVCGWHIGRETRNRLAASACRQAPAERHGFGGGRASSSSEALAIGRPVRSRDQGLEVEQRFEPALRNFGLVGGVGGVPAGVFQEVAQDDARRVGAVVTLPIQERRRGSARRFPSAPRAPALGLSARSAIRPLAAIVAGTIASIRHRRGAKPGRRHFGLVRHPSGRCSGARRRRPSSSSADVAPVPEGVVVVGGVAPSCGRRIPGRTGRADRGHPGDFGRTPAYSTQPSRRQRRRGACRCCRGVRPA